MVLAPGRSTKSKFNTVDKEKIKPDMIRARVELRAPNQFMKRNMITKRPIVDDFMYRFHDCTVYCKLDLRQRYHQLLLDPESRKIATFSNLWGEIRKKRLMFGAKASQDLFDEAIYRIFGDILRCLNQGDDILLGGIHMEEHNKILDAVLQRAVEVWSQIQP